METEVKLDLIASIAKSQHALSRILDSVADVADWSPDTARRIGENVVLLTRMQEAMAEAVAGAPIRRSRIRNGKPAVPWLNPRLRFRAK
ncbi:hypothetical protein [Paenibacillus sp. NEAU-GSW1]|uniref:hypothetical protein n=1 Tax=Paenibacillus sp. NEAU-GSW1 TaxID=2682486 RepID=UPI0020A655E2|nr:hypothetical protein [Paenibacillus sp. NEAU-GSW1]